MRLPPARCRTSDNDDRPLILRSACGVLLPFSFFSRSRRSSSCISYEFLFCCTVSMEFLRWSMDCTRRG